MRIVGDVGAKIRSLTLLEPWLTLLERWLISWVDRMELNLRHDVLDFIALAKQDLGGQTSDKYLSFMRTMQSFLGGSTSCDEVTAQVEELLADHPALKAQFQTLVVSRVSEPGRGAKQQKRELHHEGGAGTARGARASSAEAQAKKRYRAANGDGSGGRGVPGGGIGGGVLPPMPIGDTSFHSSSSSSSSS